MAENTDTNERDLISPTTLLQFNAIIIVGIFLFLTLNASILGVVFILTTMFPFVISCTYILVYAKKVIGSDGRVRIVASTLGISKWLSAGGTIYLLVVLVILFVQTALVELYVE